jgi:hypothetical protein
MPRRTSRARAAGVTEAFASEYRRVPAVSGGNTAEAGQPLPTGRRAPTELGRQHTCEVHCERRCDPY